MSDRFFPPWNQIHYSIQQQSHTFPAQGSPPDSNRGQENRDKGHFVLNTWDQNHKHPQSSTAVQDDATPQPQTTVTAAAAAVELSLVIAFATKINIKQEGGMKQIVVLNHHYLPLQHMSLHREMHGSYCRLLNKILYTVRKDARHCINN